MRKELVTIQTLLTLWKRWKEVDGHFDQRFGQYFFNQTGLEVKNSYNDPVDPRVFLSLYYHLLGETQEKLDLQQGDGCPG